MRWLFNSVVDFGKSIKETGVKPYKKDQSWAGETFQESLDKCFSGDTSKVPDAERLLEKVNASIELPSRQWQTDVVGFFPSVPDYLTGHPECMRRISDTSSEHAPIRIFVNTTSSASCDWKQLQNRGVAILAVVMALARSRPIELWTFTSLDGHGSEDNSNVMVKVNSNPLQLSEACFALCSIGFARNLTYDYARKHGGFGGGWSRHGYKISGSKKILEGLISEQDIIIPPTHAVNQEQILKDPVTWVNKLLDKFKTEQEYA